MKNNLAQELNNPRLEQVAFRSFRHWYATTQYYNTKDILYVKHLLGHKDLRTHWSTHMVLSGSDHYM